MTEDIKLLMAEFFIITEGELFIGDIRSRITHIQ